MNLFAFSSILIIISTFSLTIFILLKGRDKKTSQLWSIVCILASVWGLGGYKFSTVTIKEEALFWWKIANIGTILAPIFYYQFVCAFINYRKKYLDTILTFAYILGFIFLIFNFFFPENFIGDLRLVFNHIYVPASFTFHNPLYFIFYIVFYWGLLLHSLLLLLMAFKDSKGVVRNQLKYCIAGSVIGWFGPHGFWILVFKIDIYPITNFLTAVYPIIFAYAILRYRLIDINLVFRKSMIYSLSAGLLTGLFLLLIMIMSSYISDFTGHASLWVSCIGALIIALLFNPLKNRIQLLIDKVFYKIRYDYYSTIQKAGSDLVALIRASDIQDYLLKLIFKTLKVKSAYFLSMDGEYFKVADFGFSSDKLSTEEMTKKLDSDSELVRLLKTRKNIIVHEELEAVENDEIDLLADELKPFKGKIAVPFFIEDRLNFILILGEKLSDDFYSDEDINLLSTISSQAAISLKNAMLYGELEQRVEDRTAELSKANEQLKNEVAERKKSEKELQCFAHKLAQSNKELEDFTKVVSHDLQEPLWKVKMFGDRLKAGYIETLGEKGKDYMERMYSAVTRMQRLINDLLALSRVTITAQPNIPVDLNRVVREVLVDLEIRIEQVKGRIETDDLPVIEADPLQMRQLFQNLIGNALKFHNNGRPPVIKISSRISDGDSCTILIEDNGIGFAVNYLDYIFGVFQRLHGSNTYKGTGMGLAICRKIVERHGGNIAAKSREGQGATFLVKLPVRQPSVETCEEISDINN